MFLYEIPRNSRLRLPIKDKKGVQSVQDCIFHHIDGMYSYITIGGPEGDVVHLGASTEMKKVKDYYKMA